MVELKLSNFVIGILIIGAIVTGYLTFFGDLATNYGVEADTAAFQSTYNKISVVNADIIEAQNSTFGLSADNDAQFFTGIWSAVKLSIKMVKSSVGLGSDIATNSFQEGTGIHAPPYISALLIGMLSILFIGAIIAMIIRRKF